MIITVIKGTRKEEYSEAAGNLPLCLTRLLNVEPVLCI